MSSSLWHDKHDNSEHKNIYGNLHRLQHSIEYTSLSLILSAKSERISLTVIDTTYLQTWRAGDRVISVDLGQYHSWWCPGSLRRQDISIHDIDYVE